MYDTLRIRSNDTNAQQGIDKLVNVREYFNEQTRLTTWKGQFKGFTISINDYGYSIEGSLSKYYFGNNLQMLSAGDTETAIEMLNDELDIDLLEGEIGRLDFGFNVELQYPVSNYIKCFREMKYLKKRGVWNEDTLNFKNNSRECVIYDKIKEMKAHGDHIPSGYSNKNILRFEMRLFRCPAKVFGEKHIITSDLFDPEFFQDVFIYVKTQYEAIEKVACPTSALLLSHQIHDVRNLTDMLATEAIRHYGLDNILSHLNQQTNLVNRNTKSRCKRKLVQLCQKYKDSSAPDLVTELDEKVKLIKAV
jgi:hypothetical protein